MIQVSRVFHNTDGQLRIGFAKDGMEFTSLTPSDAMEFSNVVRNYFLRSEVEAIRMEALLDARPKARRTVLA